MALTRDDIIAAIAARKDALEPLEVPEWGGTVYARRLSAGEAESTGVFDGGGADMTVRMLVVCLADEDGNRIFTDEDVKELSAAEFSVVTRVFAEVAKLNGMATDDLDEAIAAFAAAQPDASSSS